MAYEQNPVEYLKSIITTDSKTSWNSAHVAGKLSEDVIEIAASCFKDLDKQTKLDIMASFLHFRYKDLVSFRDSYIKIRQIASQDNEEFVRIMADMLSTYLEEQVLNTNLDHWDQPLSILSKARDSIRQNGISFHAPENMLLNPEARTIPYHVPDNFTQWQPTLTRHFQVTSTVEDVIHATNPYEQLTVLAVKEERAEYADVPAQQPQTTQKRPSVVDYSGKRTTSPTPPTTPTSGSFPFRTARPPPPPRVPSAGSSLFITKPKRPAGKPIQRSPSGGRLASAMPRGFQRTQRVQMLDFNTASELQQNNSEAIRKANEDIKTKREEERLEKKRVAEEKKKTVDSKRSRKNSSTEENNEQAQEPKPITQLPVKKAYTIKKTEF